MKLFAIRCCDEIAAAAAAAAGVASKLSIEKGFRLDTAAATVAAALPAFGNRELASLAALNGDVDDEDEDEDDEDDDFGD